MPGSNSGTWGRFCDGLGSIVVVQYSVAPIITLHDRVTAREYMDMLCNKVHNKVHAMIQTTMQFSKMTVVPFIQLKLFSHDLKSLKVNSASSLASTLTTFEHH
jgi:hypothetical protein